MSITNKQLKDFIGEVALALVKKYDYYFCDAIRLVRLSPLEKLLVKYPEMALDSSKWTDIIQYWGVQKGYINNGKLFEK